MLKFTHSSTATAEIRLTYLGLVVDLCIQSALADRTRLCHGMKQSLGWVLMAIEFDDDVAAAPVLLDRTI